MPMESSCCKLCCFHNIAELAATRCNDCMTFCTELNKGSNICVMEKSNRKTVLLWVFLCVCHPRNWNKLDKMFVPHTGDGVAKK